MKISTKYNTIFIIALIGFGVSLYLLINHFRGVAVPCNITHGCEVVLNSKYSHMLGVPLPVVGVAFYVVVLVGAFISRSKARARKLLTIALVIGSLGALSFISIQFFILKKVCQYCMAVDLTTIVLLLIDMNVRGDDGSLLPSTRSPFPPEVQ